MKTKNYLLLILGGAVILLGLVTALTSSQKPQEIRKKAAVTEGVGEIVLEPLTTTKYPGQIFTTTVKFRTGTTTSNALTVSSIAFKITYPYSGTSPELEIVDENGNPTNQIYPDSALTSSGEWAFPLKQVSRESGQVKIEFAAINTTISGFKTSNLTPLAKIYFKVNRATTNPVVLSFDLSQSKMLTKAESPQDILKNPSSASYTLQNDSTPPARVTNLSISNRTKTTITLTWTSPTDIGPEGKATSYELKYSLSPLSETNWSSATPVTGLTPPASAGVSETFTISNLSAGATYYFGLKSTDSSGNTSSLSNTPNGSTSPATLSFGFKLQGINTSNLQRQVRVSLKTDQTTKVYQNIPFQSDSNGVFIPSSPVSLNDLPVPPAGLTVDVLVKDNNHLQKKLGNINILPADNSAPSSWNSFYLKAGDFNNEGETGYNVLNIDDIAKILSVYTALNVPVNTSNQIYDVNLDNSINIDDIALVLANYTALNVEGDK